MHLHDVFKENLMKRILLFMIIWVAGLSAFAQSTGFRISGVVSEKDGKLLEGVTVTLMRSTDSSVVKISITDKDGRYDLDKLAAQKYILAVSAVGHDSYNSPLIELSDANPAVA